MARGFSKSRQPEANYWPGFVDALTTLLLVIIFLLAVFMLAQYFLSQAIMGRDEALARLNSQIAELSDLLALEEQSNLTLRDELTQLQASLSQTTQALVEAKARASAAEGELGSVGASLDKERELSVAAQNQAALLNQQIMALRRQLAALQAALDASDARDEESRSVIANLGKRLNAALAQKVIVVPGEFFDVNPGQRRGHIPSRLKRFVRVSFGPEIAAVRAGLDRLDAMIREA